MEVHPMTRRTILLALFPLALLACASPDPPAAMPTASAQPAASTAPTSAPAAAVPLEVGKRIGPIALGMTRAELDGLGMAVEEGAHDLRVGPYRVMLEAGKVGFIEVQLLDLPGGLSIATTTVPSHDKDIQRIAKLFDGCGELEIRIGGNIIQCAGGTVVLAAAGPPGLVQFQLLSETYVRRLSAD
jgi:hypothetical protein